MKLAILHRRMDCQDIQRQIEHADEFGDSTFRRVQRSIVVHYRRHEADQEPIALALSDKGIRTSDGRTRQRVNETLAMLDHVHDPFITGIRD